MACAEAACRHTHQNPPQPTCTEPNSVWSLGVVYGAGEIIGRFERKGFKLRGLKLYQTPKEVAEEHYKVSLCGTLLRWMEQTG